MNRVAIGAGNLAARMAAADTAGVSGLVLMAAQADLVGVEPGEFGGIFYILRIDAFGVCLGAGMAGVTGSLHVGVSAFGECPDEFIVTAGAGIRSFVFILLLLLAEEGHGESHQKKKEVTTLTGVSSEHVPGPR